MSDEPTVTREERDLMVRWVRDFRREQSYCRRAAERAERIYRRMRALDPRQLVSAPSPRAVIH